MQLREFVDGRTPIELLANVRAECPAAEVGYLWGKPAEQSNILRGLNGGCPVRDPASSPLCQRLGIGAGYLVAERWVVSDDRTHPSKFVATSGDEHSLSALLAENPIGLLGAEHVARHGPYLASVMKLLDTHDDLARGGLSVQVHPPEGFVGRPAKPEMWKGTGKLYLGWRRDMSEHAVRAAVDARAIEAHLNTFELNGEDLVLVPGGLVHAIRAGTFTAEWSMAPGAEDGGDLSRATATVFDGTDGRTPRPNKEDVDGALEIMRQAGGLSASSMAVSKPVVLSSQGSGNVRERLFLTRHVFVEQWRVARRLTFEAWGRGLGMFVERGEIRLTWSASNAGGKAGQRTLRLGAGQECFLPAQLGAFVLDADGPALAQAWYAPSAQECAREGL